MGLQVAEETTDIGRESCIDRHAARRVYWFDCGREHAGAQQNRRYALAIQSRALERHLE
jgi:hypothetical protein